MSLTVWSSLETLFTDRNENLSIHDLDWIAADSIVRHVQRCTGCSVIFPSMRAAGHHLALEFTGAERGPVVKATA